MFLYSNNNNNNIVNNVVVIIMFCIYNMASGQLLDMTSIDQEKCDNCIEITKCLIYSSLLEVKSKENMSLLKNVSCGFKGRMPKICCPTEDDAAPIITTTSLNLESKSDQATSLLPDRCGYTPSLNRIVGGSRALIGVYSWIVALGYIEKGLDEVEYLCGGSLISNNYVLTAAHCLDPNRLLQVYDLSVIKIGEWNLKTDPDCEYHERGRECIPPSEGRAPGKIILHPEYNSLNKANDIALIRLQTPVQFTEFIQPICLPKLGESISEVIHRSKALVIGWGLKEDGRQSDTLQEVRLPHVSASECNTTYRGILNEHQICFGGIDGQDSCKGDSGGPIFLPSEFGPPYVQAGVVSFGPPACGIPRFPGVYTSVPSYRQWIEDNLEP